jgi:ABC-type transport system involved in cytochrome c biogenesis permease subunit
MLLFTILQIFKDSKLMRILVNSMHVLLHFVCLTHFDIKCTLASGHAPWSNAYEAIVLCIWATMFFGLAFDIKSKLTVASAAFVTSMILSAAYMNWIEAAEMAQRHHNFLSR